MTTKVACKTHWCSEFVEGTLTLWQEKDHRNHKHTTTLDESSLICRQAAYLYEQADLVPINNDVEPCELLYYKNDEDFVRQVTENNYRQQKEQEERTKKAQECSSLAGSHTTLNPTHWVITKLNEGGEAEATCQTCSWQHAG